MSSANGKKIVLLEVNEIPRRIIDDFVDENPKSALAAIYPDVHKYETIAEDAELSPWVTWPSVHRGVDDRVHGISNFGQELQALDAEYPPIWKLAASAGKKVGVFGSLHTYPLPEKLDKYSFFVPDFFAWGNECHPQSVAPFQDFVLAMARSSARNVSTAAPRDETVRFLTNLTRLGIRPQTAIALAAQLISERREPWKKARRRTYQTTMAFDVYLKLLRKSKPDLSTFFTNHVASSMHRYWAARHPSDYSSVSYSQDWQDRYRDEISWSVRQLDKQIGQLSAFVESNSDHQLWITSSMGQAATVADNVAQTQLYLDDLSAFMSHFGFSSTDYDRRPAMLPRIVVKISDSTRVEEFDAKTNNIELADAERGQLALGEGTQIRVEHLGDGVFMIRTPVIQNYTGTECVIESERRALTDLGLRNSTIEDESGQTAYHIPEGLLLVHDPASRSSEPGYKNISSLDIAPMALRTLGLQPPTYMRGAKDAEAVAT